MRPSLAGLIVCLVLFPTSASAWSNKEHMQLTRIAAGRLIARDDTPAAMKDWLRKGVLPSSVPDAKVMDMEAERKWFMTERIGLIVKTSEPLAYWATMPDMITFSDADYKKTEPWGVHERLLHYIDLEFFMPEGRREYRHDLSNKPKIEDIPDDPKDARYQRAGFLPFRVRECYGELVKSIRAGRLTDEMGKHPRDEHAHKWAGYVAHYLADNTQPQHATADYKSSAYFLIKRGAPNVHSEMEYRMCDDEDDDYADLRAEFWPLFARALDEGKDPVETKDLFRATLEVSMASYDALPMIGVAAMAAAKQGGTPEKPEGAAGKFDTRVFFRSKGKYMGREMTVMEMKAIQTAWAVKRIERVWLQAWAEAQK